MATTGTRISVRHAGDHSPEWLAESERKAAERRAELEARIAATDPELVAWATKAADKRRRR